MLRRIASTFVYEHAWEKMNAPGGIRGWAVCRQESLHHSDDWASTECFWPGDRSLEPSLPWLA